MRSASRIEILLSEGAKQALAELEQRAAEKLALHLLTLRKEPRPKESRRLGDAPPEDRIWEIGEWEILYRIESDRQVVVGVIRARR